MRRSAADRLRETAIAWFLQMHEQGEDDDVRARFERWLGADPAHARIYAEVGRLWDSFDSTHRLDRLTSALEQQNAQRRRTRSHRMRTSVAGLCAALAIALGGHFGYQSWQRQPLTSTSAQASLGTQVTRHLDDGSTMLLNTGSDADIVFYRDRREIHLNRGEAIFEVAPDADRPFVVLSGKARITVVGTRFAVNLLSSRVRISVERGTVRAGAALADETDALVLHAGDVAEVMHDGTAQRVQRDAADAFSFADGVITFDRAGMAEIADTLSRYRQPPLVAADGLDPDIEVSALIRASTLESFIRRLPDLAPVRVESEPSRTVIQPAARPGKK